MEKKRTRGRRRIDIKKIENENDRHVTFSKRRSGVYKKASELCTLCDTKIGIVIFSRNGKPFSFAHPNMESITNQFFKRAPQLSCSTTIHVDARRKMRIDELTKKLSELPAMAKAEKERGEKLDQMIESHQSQNWWEKPLENFNNEEVERLTAWFEELHMKTGYHLSKLGMGTSSSSSTSFVAANLPHVTYPLGLGTN